MTIGTIGYVLNDALVRRATDQGLGVYQSLFLRSVAISVLFAALVVARGEKISLSTVRGPVIVRMAAEISGAALFFGAFVHIDFANAQTILLIVPMAVTLSAALWLGEQVSGRLYATVLAGFVGVVLVVQPATSQFSGWSLVILASAAFLVVREFATRNVRADVSASFVALITAVGLALLTGALSMFAGWGAITGDAMVTLGLAGASLMIGYVFTIQTVRVGDLSASAPFRYIALPGAVVFGFLFFGEIPNLLTILGCAVILVAGVYAVRLERSARPSRV